MRNYFNELIEQNNVVENEISNEESAFSKVFVLGIDIWNFPKISHLDRGRRYISFVWYALISLDLIQLITFELSMTDDIDKFDEYMDFRQEIAPYSQKKFVIEIGLPKRLFSLVAT